MTTAPFVELRFNPTDLRPQDLPRAGAFLGSPADAIEASLAVARAAMVDQMKTEVRGLANPTHAQLLRIADLAWQATFWRFRKISAPVMADAYLRAYIAADAGDVPMSVLYELSEKHAEKVGEYFHQSSAQALGEGFNTLVNRRMPAKAAADTVLDAYGLTSRQMRAYTSTTTFTTPISDVLPRPVKAKARTYIDKSFTGRIRKLSAQEEHNIDEQAKQFAWMWLQDKGRLNENAMKLWITAKDERVCKICGPLHNKRVKVGNQFKTAHGDFWTPGLHPNCRCVVRLLEMRFSKALGGHDLYEFNQLHPRAEGGRFGVKTRTKTVDVDEEFARIVSQPVRHLTYSRTAVDPQQDLKFAEIAQYSVLPTARANVRAALPQTYAVVSPEVETEVWTPLAQPTTEVESKVKTKVGTQAKPKLQPKAKLKPVVVETKTKTGQLRYVVLHGVEYDPQNPTRIELNPGDIAYTSKQQAEAEASRLVQAQVRDTANQLLREGKNTFTTNRGHRYQLSPEQLRKVVAYTARRDQIDQGYALESPMNITMPEPVKVVDERGNQVSDPFGNPKVVDVPLPHLREYLGLRDTDFGIGIAAIPAEYGQQSSAAHDELDPTATEFQGVYEIDQKGWAKGQKFNALHVEVRTTPPKPDPSVEQTLKNLRRLKGND